MALQLHKLQPENPLVQIESLKSAQEPVASSGSAHWTQLTMVSELRGGEGRQRRMTSASLQLLVPHEPLKSAAASCRLQEEAAARSREVEDEGERGLF